MTDRVTELPLILGVAKRDEILLVWREGSGESY